MTREEVSAQLVRLREECGFNKSDVCRRAGLMFVQTHRLELAYNNFKLPLLIQYLEGLQHCMRLSTNDAHLAVHEYSQVAVFLRQTRQQQHCTVSQLARNAQCAKNAVVHFEMGQSEVHIDLFCKLCDALGITIEFVRKEVEMGE